jgi:hypothetical protein
MTLVYIRKDSSPNYVALSTDIQSSKITGANIIGATVFLTDTGQWKIISSDLTLHDYVIAITTTSSGPAQIVDQGTGGSFAWKVDGSGVDQPVSAAQLPVALAAHGGLPIEGISNGVAIPISASSMPLPTGAAADGTDGSGTNAGSQVGTSAGSGIRGWLSSITGVLQNGLGKIRLLAKHTVSGDTELVAETDGSLDVTIKNSSIAVTGPATDTQMRATPLPVSGTVTATGPLTDTQLRATAVPVSGPLTDTQLRASSVPVTGPLTDAQLRASLVPIALGDSPAIDAFSRLRISAPKAIFQSSFQYDLQPLLYEQIVVTGGSIAQNSNLSSAVLSVNGTNAASMSLQSRRYHKYTPGKSQLIIMTQVFGSAVANVRKRAGYYDTNNGIFLEQNGITDVAFTLRTSTSGSPSDVNRIVQANWNIDTFNGSGPSGATLDLSKDCILVIDLQWLGMGRVRVGFDIDGKIYYAHQFLAANNLVVPYMQTGTLPVRWAITNTAASTGSSISASCVTVISEGLDEGASGYEFSVSNPSTVSTTGTRTALLAIRPKATFNSIVNRVEIDPQEYSVLAGNNNVLVELIYNPTSLTVTGGWTSADANSVTEYHPAITGITGGTVIQSFFVASSNANRGTVNESLTSRFPVVLDSTGANPIPLVICATSLTGTSACQARINFVELR